MKGFICRTCAHPERLQDMVPILKRSCRSMWNQWLLYSSKEALILVITSATMQTKREFSIITTLLTFKWLKNWFHMDHRVKVSGSFRVWTLPTCLIPSVSCQLNWFIHGAWLSKPVVPSPHAHLKYIHPLSLPWTFSKTSFLLQYLLDKAF